MPAPARHGPCFCARPLARRRALETTAVVDRHHEWGRTRGSSTRRKGGAPSPKSNCRTTNCNCALPFAAEAEQQTAILNVHGTPKNPVRGCFELAGPLVQQPRGGEGERRLQPSTIWRLVDGYVARSTVEYHRVRLPRRPTSCTYSTSAHGHPLSIEENGGSKGFGSTRRWDGSMVRWQRVVARKRAGLAVNGISPRLERSG